MSDLPADAGGFPRTGRLLAVDPGGVRTGLAVSDPTQSIASPYAVWSGKKRGALAKDLAETAAREEIVGILVGLPLTLRGEVGPQAKGVLKLIRAIQALTKIPVATLDERFTSQDAHEVFIEAGIRASDRRGQVDKVAAAIMLQRFLEERASSSDPEPC